MLKSIEGIYRNGKIEIAELPDEVSDKTRVIVTFLEPSPINLAERGVGKTQAADLRARLTTFIEDWDSPEMDLYDDYDNTKAHLETG